MQIQKVVCKQAVIPRDVPSQRDKEQENDQLQSTDFKAEFLQMHDWPRIGYCSKEAKNTTKNQEHLSINKRFNFIWVICKSLKCIIHLAIPNYMCEIK